MATDDLSNGSKRIAVQVVYSERSMAHIIDIEVPPGTTAWNAVERARLNDALGANSPTHWQLGIFGRECPHDYLVRAGDRIEIYRPLEIDPKNQRRRRATQQKSD